MTADAPKYRPLERFWPYADLPEQVTDEELAAIEPDLYEALFGKTDRPFSITLVFPQLETPGFDHALDIARRSNEFRDMGSGVPLRYRARFLSSEAAQLHELFLLVGNVDATQVLIDDRPVPFARNLWLPLVWFLLFR
ncbi:MAG: hypothetical protein LBQ09_07095 [Acidobacteriaceae bacterium]|jgi:hypothetical protein|nr:hypothetical protein [Acidobacteriaceae bacterium]